jgi:hypothetical protein
MMKPSGSYNCPHMAAEAIPGESLITEGIADLRAGRDTPAALLVSIGAPRLAQLGIEVPHPLSTPEHRLYAELSRLWGNAAHSRYNALVRRLVSFERAYACAD